MSNLFTMEPYLSSLSEYLLDPSSTWIVIGYTLLAFVSSVALYDFGIFQIRTRTKFKVVLFHYLSLALLFTLTAFLMEVSTHGLTLKAAVNLCFLFIKLLLAFFASTIIYKLFKDYFLVWILKKLSDFVGKK